MHDCNLWSQEHSICVVKEKRGVVHLSKERSLIQVCSLVWSCAPKDIILFERTTPHCYPYASCFRTTLSLLCDPLFDCRMNTKRCASLYTPWICYVYPRRKLHSIRNILSFSSVHNKRYIIEIAIMILIDSWISCSPDSRSSQQTNCYWYITWWKTPWYSILRYDLIRGLNYVQMIPCFKVLPLFAIPLQSITFFVCKSIC